jgi:hypothetical protein
MIQQTAVEWLVNELEEYIRKSAHNELGTMRGSDFRIGLTKAIELCEQAKQMEKEQIMDAHIDGQSLVSCKDEYAEQYYNETYGDEKENSCTKIN